MRRLGLGGIAALASSVIGAGACAPHAGAMGAAEPPRIAFPSRPAPFRSPLEREHPLVGKAWDVARARFVSDAELLAAVVGAGARPRMRSFVLLGEKHDNEDHHLLQAWVLRALVNAGQRPAVAFEQFDEEKQGAIDAARAKVPVDGEAIATASGFRSSGWPAWELYEPIVKVALEARLPIVAANLSRPRARALVHGDAGDEADRALSMRALAAPWSPTMEASLRAELQASHCGMAMPEPLTRGMVLAERARDLTLATDLVLPGDAHGSGGSGVLVAGTGHTRKDRGAPLSIAALAPGAAVVSVAFVEVEEGRSAPTAYAARWNAEALPFDYVMFTPRANDDDPCEKMRGPPPLNSR